MNHARIEEIAARASEMFFAEVFKYLPEGTTGDFPPDATIAFEKAAADAVRTLMLNVPPKKYYLLYEVEWAATEPGEDAPMDREHHLETTDDRITSYQLLAIGDAGEIREACEINAGLESVLGD